MFGDKWEYAKYEKVEIRDNGIAVVTGITGKTQTIKLYDYQQKMLEEIINVQTTKEITRYRKKKGYEEVYVCSYRSFGYGFSKQRFCI